MTPKTTKKTTKRKIKKGTKYECSVCGCVDVCDIICCGKQMKSRKNK